MRTALHATLLKNTAEFGHSLGQWHFTLASWSAFALEGSKAKLSRAAHSGMNNMHKMSILAQLEFACQAHVENARPETLMETE